MSLQLILGKAGTGKSTVLLEQVMEQLLADRHKKMILIVPEQATFNYEYFLATNPLLLGTLSVQILSFQRLAWMLMQEQGGASRQVVNDLGKLMILRKEILATDRDFEIFHGAADKPGYLKSLAETISEFKRYQLSAEGLKDILENQELPQTLLSKKILALSKLYQAYAQELSQNAMDGDDVLNVLGQQIPSSVLLADTAIFIDEFYGFTPQELMIIEQLLIKVPAVTVALTLDPFGGMNQAENQLFAATYKTQQQLLQLAKNHGVLCLPMIKLSVHHRQAKAGDLDYLADAYFKAVGVAYEYAENERTHLHLIQGQNHQGEVDKVAREIRRLSRDEGYHYSEMGIFTRDFSVYDLLLQTALTDYDIPYFLDSKRLCLQHPLMGLLTALLDIVQSNWRYQAVFQYLKTDLVPIEREAIDQLENYVLSFGIRGSRWYQDEPWTYQKRSGFDEDGVSQEDEEKLADINEIRAKVIGPLVAFQEEISKGCQATELVQAIFTLLESLGVADRLKDWTDLAIDQGELELAQTHHQVWDNVMNLFDQMVELMGTELVDLADFATILTTGFDNMDLGLIPSSLDQVFVGSLGRSRNNQLKVVFVLGINEGVFPGRITEDGFFNDFEKELLEDMGIALAPTSKERVYDEQFLIYLALTKPSEALYLSYPLADGAGKGLKPSVVIRQVKSLLPQLVEEVVAWPPHLDEENVLDYISHPQKTLAFLGNHLAEQGENLSQIWRELYNWYLKQEDTRSIESVIKSLFFTNNPQDLPPELLKILYPSPVRLSVSGIEKYKACPYAHFLSYGLRLKERPIYKLENLDVGQFYHKAIEQFSLHLDANHLEWGDLSRGEIKSITSMIVEQLAPQLQNEILLSSGRYHYIKNKLAKTLERSAVVLAEHGKNGDFKAAGVEILFGDQGQLPSLKLSLADGTILELVGRIDRVEKACLEDRCYLRVIDFKTGTKGLSLLEIFYGLKIQLLAYLKVVLGYYQSQAVGDEAYWPAGVLYYFFKNPMVSGDGPLSVDEIEREMMAQMVPKGLLAADLEAIRLGERNLTVGKSLLLPFTLKKTAEPYLSGEKSREELENDLALFDSRSVAMVSHEQLELLLSHVLGIIKETGEDLLSGRIPIAPCKSKGFESCQYCSFHSVCQFDLSWQGNDFNLLIDVDAPTIWQALEQEKNQGQVNDRG